MKKNILKYITVIFMVLSLLSSCKDDTFVLPDAPTYVEDIVITGVDNSVTAQYLILDTLKLFPEVKLEGQDSKFTYQWSRVVNNVLKPVSTDQNLSYKLDTLGTFIFRLEVTHEPTGMKKAVVKNVNVGSKSQNGWYILKENADGNTDVDFVSYLTNGSLSLRSDLLLNRRGSSMTGKPVGIGYNNEYIWYVPNTNIKQTFQTILTFASAQEIVAFRPTDERILGENADLFYEPASRQLPLLHNIPTPTQQILVGSNRKAMVMNNVGGEFRPDLEGDYALGSYFTLPLSELWNSSQMLLVFDEKKSSFAYIKKGNMALTYFPNTYLAGVTAISSNNLNGKVVFMENTAPSLDPLATYAYAGTAYALFQETGRTDRMKLYGLMLSELDAGITVRNATHSPIASEKILLKADYPALFQATHITLAKSNAILYFVANGYIGYYDILKNEYNEQWAILPAGEVTWFKMMLMPNTGHVPLALNHLLVATHNNGAYTLNKYAITGTTISTPTVSISGKGKLKQLFASSSLSLKNSLHRYY